MLHIIIPFFGAFVAPLMDAHTVIRYNDLQISYHGTMNITCDDDEYRFQAIMKTKLSDCVIECALREHCAVMNYRRDHKLCELHQINVRTSNLTENCFRVEREDINITQSPCQEMPCPNGTACDRKTKTCRTKECLDVPRIKNGRVLGNLRGVGNRIKYKCDQGYQLMDISNEVATCLENGTWSMRGECMIAAPAVGEQCSEFNCLHPSARCVAAKADSIKYCFCNVGFEFNDTLGICVEVCKQYSKNDSEFQGKNGFVLSGYNFKPSNTIKSSFPDCVNHCNSRHPLYLSIEFCNDERCRCGTISEQQYIVAHDSITPRSNCSLYNRPCTKP